MKFNKLIAPLLSAGLCVNAVAGPGEDWEWNGFITQGYFHSDHNNMYGQSEDGSFDFREVAVNGSWAPVRNLTLNGQLMSRRAGEVDDGQLQVDYALLDYRFAASEQGRSGVRVGRIKNPFGFYNATRDVAFTRPSIMLPQAVYFDIARDMMLSSDGAVFYGSRNLTSGRFDLDLLLGWANTRQSVEYAYLSDDWPGSIDGDRGFMWRALYNTHDQGWRAGVTMGRFRLGFDADEAGLSQLSLVSPLLAWAAPKDGHIDIDAYLLSVQRNLEQWSFTAEYARQKLSWGSLQGVFASDPVNWYEAGYLQAEYRFNARWSAVARYEKLYFDMDDRNGEKAAARLGKPAHTQYAQDLTLGIGWRPDPRWLLRAEWHHVNGTAWLPEQDNPESNDLVKQWNLFALQATYRF